MSKNLCIILDFDGVLTKLDVDWKLVIKKVSQLLGKEIHSLYEVILRYWRTSIYNDISNVIEEFELKSLEKAYLIPNLDELRELAQLGTLCIASLQSRRVIELFLRRYNIHHFFKIIMTRDDYPRKYMQVFKIVNELQVNPRYTYLIDDLERNCDECVEIGINCIVFSKETCRYMYVKSFREILDFLKNVQNRALSLN